MRSLFVRNPSFVSTFKSPSWIHHQIKLHQPPKPPIRFSPFSSNHHLQFSATLAFKPSISNFSASAASMGAISDEEGLSRRFWIKFQKESAFSIFSPFVVCLASGRLESEAFRHYIAQDVHFLRAFVQAYKMAEECADDDDDKDAICELKKGVLEAMRMHDSFVQEWGIDLAKETTPNSATVKYTGFLLKTASGKVEGGKDPGKIATPFEKTKIAAYTLGAMTPCMRLYAFLGKKLQPCLDPVETSPLYRKWIDKYASECFESAAQQSEDLLDKLSISLTGEELKVIEGLYHQALKLEIEFFSAQPIVQCSVVPLSRNGPEDLIARKSSADLRNSWDVLSSQYAEEHEQCIERIMPSEPAEAFNYEGLCKALEELSDFEQRANSRVIESGVLKGLNSEDIKRAGERLVLQDGCTGFFQQLVKRMVQLNADVHILSYCWCGDLIRSAFSSGLQ